MAKFTDETRMPFGKHKGGQLINVPASYLIWLYDNQMRNGALKNYIEDNLDVLRQEIKEQKHQKR